MSLDLYRVIRRLLSCTAPRPPAPALLRSKIEQLEPAHVALDKLREADHERGNVGLVEQRLRPGKCMQLHSRHSVSLPGNAPLALAKIHHTICSLLRLEGLQRLAFYDLPHGE